jgi:protein SCO1/2
VSLLVSRHRKAGISGAVLGALIAGWTVGLRAQRSDAPAPFLRNVGIDQKLNQEVPLDIRFRDETGQTTELRQYFDQKPVILSLVYYECPMLCTEELNGLLSSLKNISLDIGKDFNVVTVSFNPREGPPLASSKKAMYTSIYGRSGAENGWHFLTGEQSSIEQLTRAVGYRYAYDPGSGQYAHATGIMILTPAGRISRYFYGIAFPPRDLRLGLVEASAERIGSPVDQLLLFCYHYDPKLGKYGLMISNVIRLSGLVTVLVMGLFIALMFRRERRSS